MSISANKSRNIMEHIGFPQEAADTICDCTERVSENADFNALLDEFIAHPENIEDVLKRLKALSAELGENEYTMNMCLLVGACPALRERYAVAGREPVTIHPQDARARGIADGDLVRVWNARGQVLAGAVVTEGIRPGVICLHEGAWPDLDPRVGICKNGAVNVLTKDIPTSRLGNGCAGNTALAWLEKYTGPTLPLTAFDPPANA